MMPEIFPLDLGYLKAREKPHHVKEEAEKRTRNARYYKCSCNLLKSAFKLTTN